VVATASCGTAGQKTGTQCSGLTDCGGTTNFVTNVCPNCFGKAAAQVCEAGTCRATNTGATVSISLAVPPTAQGARSFVLAVLAPVMADGTQITCSALLSNACTTVDNPLLNASSSTFKNVVGAGGADPSAVYPVSIGGDVGSGRLLVVKATASLGGQGAVMAQGCIGGLEVVANQTLTVDECPSGSPGPQCLVLASP
jgi:hypothetical protein